MMGLQLGLPFLRDLMPYIWYEIGPSANQSSTLTSFRLTSLIDWSWHIDVPARMGRFGTGDPE